MNSRKMRLLFSNLLMAILVASIMIAPPQVGNAGNDAWSIVTSPNTGTNSNFLRSVAAVSLTDVWAVGDYVVPTFYSNPLSLHWNGTQWGTVSVPIDPDSDEIHLYGVAVVTANDVWAVGYASYPSANDKTFIVHWNGTAWSIVQSPNQGTDNNQLTSVAVVNSQEVWAVGYYGPTNAPRTLTMKWNGSVWSIVTSPSPARPGSVADYLTGVAASSSGDVKAVGYFYDGSRYKTLALHWDAVNQVWLAPSIPNGTGWNILKGITIIGTGSNDAYAVGYSNGDTTPRTLVLHWNGSAWSIQTNPNYGTGSNQLDGVAPVSSTDIWTAGYANKPPNVTLTERRTGGNWNIVSSPNQSTNDNFLQGIAVTPGTSICAGGDIWSVGYYNNGSGVYKTLILRYTIIPGCRP